MKKMRANSSGATLLEVMLVLLIATFFTVMSMRMYQTMRNDSDVALVQSNVDKIFLAAANYYQAHCRSQMDAATGAITNDPESLAPTASFAPPNPSPVTVAKLIADGFLNDPPTPNGIIVNTGPPNYGYIVQFNLVVPEQQKVMTTSNTPLTTLPLGKIIMWRVQVAAQVQVAAKARIYKTLLIGDCLSTVSGQSVNACTAASASATTGTHIVWERLPSYASPESTSTYWQTNAMVKQFNQLYHASPIGYEATLPAAEQQNYLCGS